MTLTKREQTRQTILSQALQMASIEGLNGLTIGTLASRTGLSKSGLFSHFHSKENLQLAVLEHATRCFISTVIDPVRHIDDPVQRLQQLVSHWLGWYERFGSNCIYITAMTEFDDRPGPLRDYIAHQQSQLIHYLAKMSDEAVAKGLFHPAIKGLQFAYELYSLYIGSQMLLWMDLENDQRRRFQDAFSAQLERARH